MENKIVKKCHWCGKELYEKDIKSIVTKEQFEMLSYKVGE